MRQKFVYFFDSIFLIASRDKLMILYKIPMKLFIFYPNLLLRSNV